LTFAFGSDLHSSYCFFLPLMGTYFFGLQVKNFCPRAPLRAVHPFSFCLDADWRFFSFRQVVPSSTQEPAHCEFRRFHEIMFFSPLLSFNSGPLLRRVRGAVKLKMMTSSLFSVGECGVLCLTTLTPAFPLFCTKIGDRGYSGLSDA